MTDVVNTFDLDDFNCFLANGLGSSRNDSCQKVYFLTCRDSAKASPGLSHQKAYNINLALAQLGVIEVVRAGDPHPGGRASHYQYLLPQSGNGERAIAR